MRISVAAYMTPGKDDHAETRDARAVRLDATTVLGGVIVPPGYRKVGSSYLSPGFKEQGHLEVDASLAIGGITLSEY